MTKKELLLAIIDHYANGNKAIMARQLGVTPQAISTWLARGTFDIELLYAKCEDLNPLWLLNGGKGPMLRTAEAPAAPAATPVTATPVAEPIIAPVVEPVVEPIITPAVATEIDAPVSRTITPYGTANTLIPIYNAEASAGHGALILDNEHIVGQLQLPFAKAGDIALSTVGNSMQPEIFCGDILVVRPRQNWREYLETGKIYVILTDEELYVKVISAITPNNTMVLHSYNPQYPDFEVPLQYIKGIFKVIGIVSQRSY